jgi:hypothetical protein
MLVVLLEQLFLIGWLYSDSPMLYHSLVQIIKYLCVWPPHVYSNGSSIQKTMPHVYYDSISVEENSPFNWKSFGLL